MSKFAIRLLMLAIFATALAAVPRVTTAEAAASGHAYLKKHNRHTWHGFSHPAFVGAPPPLIPSYGGGPLCPTARSFDCKIWPPPISEDPDRRVRAH